MIINNSKTLQDDEVDPDKVFELLISPNFSAASGVAGSVAIQFTGVLVSNNESPNNALKQTLPSLRYGKAA